MFQEFVQANPNNNVAHAMEITTLQVLKKFIVVLII